MPGDVVATYRLESYLAIEQAAAVLAGEQSTGTFVRVSGETDDLRQRHRAELVSVEDEHELAAASLPSRAYPGGSVRAAVVRIRFPLANFGTSLAGLLTSVAGNLFELRELTGAKLLDLDLPPAFANAYPGPAFGVEGTRRLMDVATGPMLGTIIKPSLGLSADQYGKAVADLCAAGIDFVKDDELLVDPPGCRFDNRVDAVMRAINEHAERTGKKVMYAFNITGDADELRRRHDRVVAAGGTCVMVCINVLGFPAIAWLRQYAAVPLHGHRTGQAALMRSPAIGIAYRAWQKLARLAGVDQLHTIGFQSKFYQLDDDVHEGIKDVSSPLFGETPYPCLPVLSSAQWAGTVPVTWGRLHTTDLLMLAGGGIFGHPGGPVGGVAALRDAWEATVGGVELDKAACERPELAAALNTFGGSGR